MTDPRTKPTPWHNASGVQPKKPAGNKPPMVVDDVSWEYHRCGDRVDLSINLSKFDDPEYIADKVLSICDEMLAMLDEQGEEK